MHHQNLMLGLRIPLLMVFEILLDTIPFHQKWFPSYIKTHESLLLHGHYYMPFEQGQFGLPTACPRDFINFIPISEVGGF